MDWLRLWHDMPNDPKWRTIARLSGQPIALVQATYLHLLVDASRNVTRGHVTVTKEDIASALDVTEDQIDSIFSAMQGRVLDGDCVTGWAKRQPKREDAGSPETGAKSAAQRKREQRERQRQGKESNSSHDESRSVTTSHDRLDTDTEETTHTPPASASPPARIEDYASRSRFAMSDAWEPESQSFTAVLARNGMANQTFHADQLLEFRSYWISRPGDHKTQAQWEHALAQQLKRQSRYQQTAGASSHETSGRTSRSSTRNAHDILTDPNW